MRCRKGHVVTAANVILLVAASLLVPSAKPLAGQVAPRPSQASLTLSADGDEDRILLAGRGVGAFRSARLQPLSGRTVPKGVEAVLGRTVRDQRPLTLRVARGATEGRYVVLLVPARGRTVKLAFELQVVGASARMVDFFLSPTRVVGGDPLALVVGLDRAAGPKGASVTLATETPGIVRIPREIQVPAGATKTRVALATAQVESPSTVSIHGTLGEIRLSTKALVEPGTRFTPLAASTAPLIVTGMRFTPLAASTAPLIVTGVRFTPLAVETPRLTATGLRFRPMAVTVPTLRMTGKKGT